MKTHKDGAVWTAPLDSRFKKGRSIFNFPVILTSSLQEYLFRYLVFQKFIIINTNRYFRLRKIIISRALNRIPIPHVGLAESHLELGCCGSQIRQVHRSSCHCMHGYLNRRSVNAAIRPGYKSGEDCIYYYAKHRCISIPFDSASGWVDFLEL